MTTKDKEILRNLAQRYAELANDDVQKERLERCKKTIALEVVRPIVFINEVPWGEIDDDALVNVCSPELRWIENRLRRALYQADHFQVDQMIPDAFQVGKSIRSSGLGIQTQDTALKADTGSHICAHEYKDVLSTEDDLEKLQLPTITHDKATTERNAEMAEDVFAGIMPVEIIGTYPSYNVWDTVATFRGVDSILMDLVMRPEFMHKTAQRFAEIVQAIFRQYEELDLLDSNQLYVHCTVAKNDILPPTDTDGKVRMKNVWGRCAAQIFGSVSPTMHDEFDLAYTQKVFADSGLLYYGCCEPMDTKIDILRKRLKNLRKVSITPWAKPERAAEAMGNDLVMAAKPNPAFVSFPNFDPKAVENEIKGYLDACKAHGTPCEFVLKDISTIGNNPENLTRWANTVNATIDKYFG